MKKFKVIFGWILVVAYLTVSFSFIDNRRLQTPCRYIKVDILDSLYNGFVTQDAIVKSIENNYPKTLGLPINEINTELLEDEILKNRAIKTCDVFKTADGTLNVEVMQRQPVLRVINAKNQSYYIDEEGFLIPYSSIQSPNVLVATGNIFENKTLNLKIHDHVDKLNIEGKNNILHDLQRFSAFVYHNRFWNAQFVQIYVNKKGELELIPRVGAHIIILGNTNDFETKLAKLKALYIKGLNNLGWNEYETINLKYKNQVICSKR